MDVKSVRSPEEPPKRKYEKPAVIHTEKVLARCVTCASADPDVCGPNGPLLGS